MAKGKPNPNWKQKVLEWQTSGKSSLTWCKENQIPYTTFFGWKQRFENCQKSSGTISQSPKGFIELKDRCQSNSNSCSGVTLEYQGIKISLQAGFNNKVLKQCLSCLGGVPC